MCLNSASARHSTDQQRLIEFKVLGGGHVNTREGIHCPMASRGPEFSLESGHLGPV